MPPVLGVLLALAAALGSGRAPGWAAVELEGAGGAGTGGLQEPGAAAGAL